MDEAALVNGVYIRPGNRDNPATGFVPYNLQLFRLSPTVEKVIRAFPALNNLEAEIAMEKAHEITQALMRNKILRRAQPPRPELPPTPGGISDVAFVLNESASGAAGSLIEFFRQQTRNTMFKSLTLISDDPASHPSLIHLILKRVSKSAAGNVRFILRVPFPPRSLRVLRLARKYNLVLHLDLVPPEGQSLLSYVEDMVLPYHGPAFKRQRKLASVLTRLAAIHPGPGDISDIPEVMEVLRKAGFMRFYLDHLCRTCRVSGTENEPVTDQAARELAKIAVKLRLDKERISSNSGGFMEPIPLFHSLLSAQRRFSGCAAGRTYCAVSAAGDIYPCHRCIGNKKYRLAEGLAELKNHDIEIKSVQRPEERQECRGCPAIYICGGAGLEGPNPDYCTFMKALLHDVLPLYEGLDAMDKNIILNDMRKIHRWLPHLKSPAPAVSILTSPRRLTVRSDSMAPLFSSGDQVRVVPLKDRKIRFGDIVCFGQPIICHRVIARYRKRGIDYIIEKGDAIPAGRSLPEQEVSGKVIAVIRGGEEIDMTRFPARLRNRWRALLSLMSHILTAGRVKCNGISNKEPGNTA